MSLGLEDGTWELGDGASHCVKVSKIQFRVYHYPDPLAVNIAAAQ